VCSQRMYKGGQTTHAPFLCLWKRYS